MQIRRKTRGNSSAAAKKKKLGIINKEEKGSNLDLTENTMNSSMPPLENKKEKGNQYLTKLKKNFVAYPPAQIYAETKVK